MTWHCGAKSCLMDYITPAQTLLHRHHYKEDKKYIQRCYNGDTLAYWWGWVLKKSHTIFNTRLIFGLGRIAVIYQFACFIFYVYVFFAALDRYSYLKMKTLPLECSICSTNQEIDWNWPIMYTQKQLNSTLLYRKPRPHSMPRATNKVSHTKASPL